MLTTLYKKATTGKIQFWNVLTKSNTYWTESGQVGGKTKKSTPTECEGKNLGKMNETSPEEQALKDAESKWKDKLKKGYVEKIGDAEAGKVDTEFVEGGYLPMLAEKFHEKGHKIVYPCYGQPKLDGHRGTSVQAKLFSRTRKSIFSCPHIEEAIEMANLKDVPLDGELYNHDLKDEFEDLSSHIRQSTPQPECKVVQYHLYDLCIPGKTMTERLSLLNGYVLTLKDTPAGEIIKIVPTEVVHSAEEAELRRQYWVQQGYEGYMLRNKNSEYQNKRTADLQKLKVFQDAEFEIVDVTDGKGKFKNIAARFICKIVDERGERTFSATANGSLSKLKEYFDNKDQYIGKLLTVEFITYTRKNQVPKHGRGIRFRDLRF